MMSCFIQLDNNSNPISIQRFDSIPGVEIIVPSNNVYIEDCSNYPSDIEILDHWRMKAGVLANVGPNPGSSYRWDRTTESWVPDLEKAKTTKLQELKKSRNLKESGGFAWDGSVFDSDPQSQLRLQGAVQLAQMSAASSTPFSIEWTLKDNTVRTLSGSDMIAVGLALAGHITAVHELYRDLKNEVDTATTVQQVDSISWP